MTDDPFETDEWREYAEHVRTDLIPMIDQSAMSMAILAGAQPDVKQAVELGFILLMDKPLILVVFEDAPIPQTLERAADAIVRVGHRSLNDVAVQAQITAAMDALRQTGRLG